MPASIAPARRLGIFFKAPVAGVVKTRLTPPLTPEQAAELYAAFLSDTVRLCRRLSQVELTLFQAPEGAGASSDGARQFELPVRNQVGVGLGERMSNALSQLLAMPPALAVVIGSDTPDLPPALVSEAFELLARHDLVLGPSTDGGYYLIGLSRPVPGLLHEIAWSTESVYQQQVARADQLGIRWCALPAWHDVDTPADLAALQLRLAQEGIGADISAPETRRIVNMLASVK